MRPVVLAGRTYLHGVLRDVTERRLVTEERERLEAQLRQAQKMEALGQLAGGVAHDFNNILTAILGNAEMLLERLRRGQAETPPERMVAALGQIQLAGERGAGLTRQLLAFSRKQVRRLELLDPNRVVGDMQRMLRRLIGEHIELETRLAPDIRLIRADVGQVEQVLLNLALNARDAMPQGGKLVIETANVSLGAHELAGHVDEPPGDYVTIRVRDTGCGMSRDTLGHIFEPFFTTKAIGKGTGLGLATVYGIVKQTGGLINVHSEPGRGSSFSVFFPAVEGREVPAQKPALGTELRGDETVLVCEDEEMVRALACEILRSNGYDVLTAADGEQALQLAERHPGEIQLLVTDTIMPGMSGIELARELSRRRSGLRVLLVSGYAPDEFTHQASAAGNLNLLQKPFSSTLLLRRVRQILDASA